MNRPTQSETNMAETATIPGIRRFRLSLTRRQGGRNVKKKIGTLLVTVAMTGALFAGPALAYDHDGNGRGRWHAAQEWREHHSYPVYAYNRWYPGYRYEHAGWHWHLIDGHWRWVR
jgi:hypothetical protein